MTKTVLSEGESCECRENGLHPLSCHNYNISLFFFFRHFDAITMSNGSLLSNTTNVTQSIIPDGAITAYTIYLSLIIALGVPGNLLVLFVYLKNRAVTSTDWFIIFITFYDLISSSINVPIYLTFITGAWKLYGSDVICKLHMFLSQSVVLSSTFLICGIAFERYCKVCQSSRSKLTPGKSRNICLVVCLISVVFSTPTFAFFRNSHNRCISANEGLLNTLMNIYYTAVFLTFVIAIGILLFSYSKIAKAIFQSELNLRKHLHTKHENITQSALKECFRSTFCCNTNKIYPTLQSTEDGNGVSRPKPTVLSRETERIGCTKTSNEQVRNRGEHSGAATDLVNIIDAPQKICLPVHHSTARQRLGAHPAMVAGREFIYNGTGGATGVYFPTEACTSTSNGQCQEDRDQRRTHTYNTQPTNGNTKSNTLRHTHHHINDNMQGQKDQAIERTHTSQPSANDHVERTIMRQTSSQSTQSRKSTAMLDIRLLSEHTRVRQCLRTTRIAFLICLIFVLSWLPPWISFINFVLLPPETKLTPTYLTINMFCRMAYLVNTFTNPILYTVLNRKFRERLRKCLCFK